MRNLASTLRTVAYFVVGVYALFGGLWILLSDRLLQVLVPDPGTYQTFQTYKGWFYVVATAALLYLLIRRAMARIGRLEEDRRRVETQFQSLVERALVGVYIIQDGIFTYINPRFAEIFGYAQDEIIGKKRVADLVVPEDRELVLENIRKRVAAEAASIRYSFHGLRKDGKAIDVEVLGTRTEFGGQPAVIGMLLDQTEHNLLQKEFLHAQKMEIVGRLAGGVAHDFNNLLTAIMGLAQMTIPTLPKEDQRREDLEEILKCSERAAALTRQLLTFSRKQLIQPRSLDLSALVRDAEKMLRRAVGEAVTLELAVASNLWKVRADSGQIEQVLMNLAVNGRDAMLQGGRLVIDTANVDLIQPLSLDGAEIPPGAYVRVTVQDTGCGMDEETLRRIFEPFFTTKEPGKGTGLGLAVIQDIVREAGGHIAVESQRGKGTAFQIYLPREQVPEATPETLSRPVPSCEGKETILLVDDESEVRRILSRILESKGYKVLSAQGYDEALRVSERHEGTIDLLATDTLLPSKGGPDLADKLTSLRPGTKVLFISGHAEDSVVRSRILDQHQPFLPKPFTGEVFLAKVRETLDTVLV